MVLHQSLTWFIMRSPHLWKSEPELCGTSPIISWWGFGDCWRWWRAFSNLTNNNMIHHFGIDTPLFSHNSVVSLALGCAGSPSSSLPPARPRLPVLLICLWGERQQEPAKDAAPPGPINPAGYRLPTSGHKVKELGIKWSKLLGTKDKADRKHKAPTCSSDTGRERAEPREE